MPFQGPPSPEGGSGTGGLSDQVSLEVGEQARVTRELEVLGQGLRWPPEEKEELETARVGGRLGSAAKRRVEVLAQVMRGLEWEERLRVVLHAVAEPRLPPRLGG
jgi:hypothetical protein